MSTPDAVLTAIFDEIETYASANSLTVDFPDVGEFSRPDDLSEMWLEVVALIDDPNDYGLAQGDAAIQRGTVRVAVCRHVGYGVIDLVAQARDVAAQWPKNFVIPGTTARVESTPGMSNPMTLEDERRSMVYASIRWRDTV